MSYRRALLPQYSTMIFTSPTLSQVDVVSPLQEVSLLVSKSPSQLAAIHKNLTSSISKLAGLSIRKSSLRPSGQATELRVYGLEGGAVLDGKELAVRLTSLPLADYDIQSIQLSRTEDEAALGSVEVAVLTMACLVFLGAFIAVLCICCIKMKRFVLCIKQIRKFAYLVSLLWSVGSLGLLTAVLDSSLIVVSPQCQLHYYRHNNLHFHTISGHKNTTPLHWPSLCPTTPPTRGRSWRDRPARGSAPSPG